MAQYMPKDTRCAQCNLPIKVTEQFVGFRFGTGIYFWHNRFLVLEDCWGKFLLEHVRNVHDSQGPEISAEPCSIPPVVH
jgi:hypothetical protein